MELRIIYREDPLWTKWKDELTFEEEFVYAAIILQDDGILKGQSIIYHNPYHLIKEEKCVCVGNVQLPDDEAVFDLLQTRIGEIASRVGVGFVVSTMNGSTWNDYRFVTFQPKSPFLLETTTESYIYEQFKRLQYERLASYFSQETTQLTDNWEMCKERYQYFVDQGMTFSPFDLEHAEEEFRSLATFCNRAFRKNFLFSPIREDDFIQKMMPIVPFLNPAYTIIARVGMDVAGFIFAYEDIRNSEGKSIIVKTLARDIDKPFGGLGTILSALVMKAAIADEFTHCIHALMINHNASTNVSDNFHGQVRSTYELLYCTV